MEDIVCYTPDKIILLEDSSPYSQQKIIERARRQLGREKYNLLSANCEHFATNVRTGTPVSPQVPATVGIIMIMALLVYAVLKNFLPIAVHGLYLLLKVETYHN